MNRRQVLFSASSGLISILLPGCSGNERKVIEPKNGWGFALYKQHQSLPLWSTENYVPYKSGPLNIVSQQADKFMSVDVCDLYASSPTVDPTILHSAHFDTSRLSSGLYILKTQSPQNEVGEGVWFVTDLTNRNDITVLVPTFTHQAYNLVGGNNYYTENPTQIVNINRPLGTPSSYHDPRKTGPTHLLDHQGTPYDVIGDMELHTNREILKDTKVLIITGHSEYWTYEMRENVQSFIEKGGNVLILSGNTMWWKVLLEDGDIMRCDKENAALPETGNWNKIDHEVRSIGLSFEYAGYPIKRFFKTYDELNATHPGVMSKLEYNNSSGYETSKEWAKHYGAFIEVKESFVGVNAFVNHIETDGLPLTRNFEVDYNLATHAPKSMKVLFNAWVMKDKLSSPKKAAVGVEFKLSDTSGKVINLGSIGWDIALWKKDPEVSKLISRLIESLIT